MAMECANTDEILVMNDFDDWVSIKHLTKNRFWMPNT